MLALGDESKIIKKLSDLKKYVLGCKRSVHPTQEAAKNISLTTIAGCNVA